MEIPLFVLVLQIGFNAALNNRGYSSNPVIRSPRFVNSGQTRRLPETDSYMLLSSRGIAESDEQSDSEYSNSFEDFSYRSVRPLRSRPNQRRNNYLRYSARPENDVSLEAAPVGRINSDNYAERLQPYAYSSRRTNPYLRRPYLRNGLSNLRPSQTRQYYRKANDDLSIEVSSLESSNPEDVSRLGVEGTYLRSLLSLIEQQNNRRGQNRKYYRKRNSLSIDASPIDKLEHDEDAVYSLPNSLNKRRNNNHNAYTDRIILVSDDDQSDETRHNSLYNRRYDDGLSPDEDFYNYLSPRRGLKPRPRGQQLTNDSPITRKLNNNAGVEWPLNDEVSLDGDSTGKLTVLRLANLEDLNLESPIRRSDNNRKNNHRNFLRLSLSPDNELALDEGVASDLSDILSETLDELNLAPANLRRTDLSNNKNSRRENNRLNTEENNLSNLSLLRLGSLDNPKAASPLRRYSELINRSNNRNLRTHGNHTRQDLKKLFDEDTAKTLVPYHEGKSIKLLSNRKNENNNSRDDGFPDEFSLDTLFAYKKEGNFSSDLTALRSTNQDNLNLKTPLLRSSDDILPKDTSDTLHLELPWNDQLSLDGDKSGSLLRSDDQRDNTKDTTDTLNLEFPWNGALSPDGDKDKSQLRTSEKTNKTKDYTDTLDLEFPWNGVLSTDGDKSKSQLRTSDKTNNTKDYTDTLDLEFPWNDVLSPDGDKGKSKLRTGDKTDNTKDYTDTLDLEFPWNGVLSPDGDKSKSQLRTSDKTDNTKDYTHTLDLEFPWNDVLSPDGDKGKSQLKTGDKTDNTTDYTDTLDLEFPWNDVLSPDGDKGKSQLKTGDKTDNTTDYTDTLDLEFPWNGVLSPNGDKGKSQLRTGDKADNTKDYTDTLDLELPWNGVLSPDGDKGKSQLRTGDKTNNTKKNSDTLDLEFPWNDALSPDSYRSKSQLRSKENTKDTMDTLHLEFPWNDQLSPDETKTRGPKLESLLRRPADNRQDKEPKDELKLEFPLNDKTSSDKPSSKKTTLRIPDPFFVHPYLRNRNVNRHPDYFRRSYDEFSESLRLENLRERPSKKRRQSKRRRYDKLKVMGLARRSSQEDPSDWITFPSDRRPQSLRIKENTPPLVTTTSRPNYSQFLLRRAGGKTDRNTYNDTIIFPND